VFQELRSFQSAVNDLALGEIDARRRAAFRKRVRDRSAIDARLEVSEEALTPLFFTPDDTSRFFRRSLSLSLE